MPLSIDITGKRFGRLVAIGFSHKRGKAKYWECKCDCGKVKNIYLGNLRGGKIRSCGCFKKEQISKQGRNNKIHGMREKRIYHCWRAMRSRCENPNHEAFERYGGRGIAVCKSWRTAAIFFKWALKNGYQDNLSIDRIDNDKGYSPGNCRWSTAMEQRHNRREGR